MLVLMKYFGCRSMSLVRYFSDTIEAISVKRKNIRNVNYYVPTLSENRKQVNYSIKDKSNTSYYYSILF